MMMKPASTPDPIMINAINHLRGTSICSVHFGHPAYNRPRPDSVSGRFALGALTNNFLVPGAPQPPPPGTSSPRARISPKPKHAVPYDELKDSLLRAAEDPNRAGSPNEMLKSLFDIFVESSVERLRLVAYVEKLQSTGDEVRID